MNIICVCHSCESDSDLRHLFTDQSTKTESWVLWVWVLVEKMCLRKSSVRFSLTRNVPWVFWNNQYAISSFIIYSWRWFSCEIESASMCFNLNHTDCIETLCFERKATLSWVEVKAKLKNWKWFFLFFVCMNFWLWFCFYRLKTLWGCR